MHRFRNTLTLTLKEFRSLLSDAVMMGLIIVIFTVAVIAIAKGISIEVRNASVAIVDEDHSSLAAASPTACKRRISSRRSICPR